MKKIVLRVVDLMVYVVEAPEGLVVEVHDWEAPEEFSTYVASPLIAHDVVLLDADDTEGGTHD